MSDDCRCDKCGARGRRRRFTFAPEGWFFIETLVDDEEPEQGTTVIRVLEGVRDGDVGAGSWGPEQERALPRSTLTTMKHMAKMKDDHGNPAQRQ